MKNFEYKGVSSAAFDIVVEAISRPILPAVKPRLVELYGRSGVVDHGGGDYGTILIALQIAYVGKDAIELQQRTRDIGAWLSNTRFEKLIISDEADKYYRARVLGGVDFKTFSRLGKTDIAFDCQPFAYMVVDTSVNPTWEEADFTWVIDLPINTIDSYQFSATGNTSFLFNNPGTVIINKNSPQGSKSDIIVTGIWTNISISLNGSTLTFSEPSVTNKSLVINNVNMEITLNGANKLSKLSGDIDSFLSIVPGDNTINISGTGVNVNVLLDFTPQWM